MKNIVIIAAIGLVIVIGGMVYYFSGRSSQPSPTPTVQIVDQTQPDLTPLPTSAQVIETTDTTTLRAGGSSYLDPKGVFGFLYPSDYTLDTQDSAHIRIFKRGETQRPQSEMSDGALIVFESVDLGGKTLSEFVDTRIKESTADGTSQVTQAKKATSLNVYPGFTYSMQGLGESTYFVYQKSPQSGSAVVITYMVADPQQKGYQKEVDAVLSTLELHK